MQDEESLDSEHLTIEAELSENITMKDCYAILYQHFLFMVSAKKPPEDVSIISLVVGLSIRT